MPLYKDKENNPVAVIFNKIPKFVKFIDNTFLFQPSNPAADLG